MPCPHKCGDIEMPTTSKPYGLHFIPKHVIYMTVWVKFLFHCPQVPKSPTLRSHSEGRLEELPSCVHLLSSIESFNQIVKLKRKKENAYNITSLTAFLRQNT